MMTDFIDRPIDLHLGTDVVESINAYLHKLEEQGAINGGRAWLDSELNTKESLAAGNLYINVDFGPKSPAQTNYVKCTALIMTIQLKHWPPLFKRSSLIIRRLNMSDSNAYRAFALFVQGERVFKIVLNILQSI